MSTVAFVPIKLNNQRTPGKNTKRFSDGLPLLEVPLQTLLKVKWQGDIDDIIVYCSDDSIKEYLPKGVIYMTRPKYLDSQSAKNGDIIEEFVKNVDSELYIMYHVTSPFITADHIVECINAVKSGRFDSAFGAKKLQNFLWFDNKPVNFSLDYAPRTQDMKPYYCELSSPYVFTKNVFYKYHGRTGINPFICECSEIEAIDIDYPEDFELANVVYMNLIKNK